MRLNFPQFLVATLLCCPCWGLAAITCTTPVSSGFSTAYAPTGVVPNVTQGSVSFTCTRSAAGDPTSLLLRGSNGVNGTGNQNRARLSGTNYLSYEAYQNSACTSVWTNNSNGTSIPIALAAVTTPQTINASYWGCLTLASQAVPAGTYTDTVTMQVRNGGTILSSGTFTVSITNPASCSIATAPGNVVFNYTAFGPAVNASTTFVTNCTVNLPYSMSLDTDRGVVSGLNYSLKIDSITPPVSGRNPGPALAETHTINGSMQAGQAGTCSTGSCSASQLHTLTITY